MSRAGLASRIRDEAGWTLTEALVVSALLAVVLAAALTPFAVLGRTDRVTQNQNDSQDNARNVMGEMSRKLRNVSGQNQLVNLAAPYDIVLETIDPFPPPSGSANARNLMKVRYCLDTTSAGATLTNGRIWEQVNRWTTANVPTTLPGSACPDPNWGTSRRILADRVTNSATSSFRPTSAPLFTYFPNANNLDMITSVRVSLYTDANWDEAPRETELTSGIFLRNQNGAPTASFTVTPGSPGTKKLTLNAGTSTDPEGLPLVYRWCDTTTNTLCDNTTKVGTGVLYTYTAPAANARKIVLQAIDVGGLQATAGPLTVTAP
jgi:type II secretory pathway pseudopilin PulG